MRKKRFFSRYLLALVSAGLGACHREPAVVEVEPGVPLALAEYRATVISDLGYRLQLSVPREEAGEIPGHIAIEFQYAGGSRPLQIDFREDARRLQQVLVNGNPADVEFTREHLVISPGLLRRGGNVVEISFIAGQGSLNRNPDFLYTLFVPDRARTAFPLFDQPDLKATWELSLEIPGDWTAMANAPVQAVEADGDRKTVHFARSDLISSYLFSFVAGKFDSLAQEIDGRSMTLLHRETDRARVARNVDEIFRLHAAAIAWMEDYTGIDYPFRKLDFALLPAHPYGGMEHVGAIQYRAERLWLDEAPSDTELLNRASLIAHEVAHMWFGNLVTMRWFDDVWTKEVFANFMAAKIVNPAFPSINHDLNFLVSSHPGAYSVDRTAGANPIRQALPNLDQAGQLYGAIIYDKAPIMMRQLEALLGEEEFRAGIRRYLERFAHANASWPELIQILDAESDADIAAWSEVWVNSPGRPRFVLSRGETGARIEQQDPAGLERLWPQRFGILGMAPGEITGAQILALDAVTPVPAGFPGTPAGIVFNSDGYGYGLFPAELEALAGWQQLDPLPLASLLINLHEQMLEHGRPAPADYLAGLLPIARAAENQLLLRLALDHIQEIYWTLLPGRAREELAPRLEQALWQALADREQESVRKIFFNAFADIALSPAGLERLGEIWSGDLQVDRLPLSERDMIRLSRLLAIKQPGRADKVIARQLERTENPDQRRRLEFIAPSLSADAATRHAFFASLADVENRHTESWVLDALANLHHPLRLESAEAYITPSLELLEEIQASGDIFFPAGWLRSTLDNHHSDRAVADVQAFLAARPDYNPQLKMKILQALDPVLRANRILAAGRTGERPAAGRDG